MSLGRTRFQLDKDDGERKDRLGVPYGPVQKRVENVGKDGHRTVDPGWRGWVDGC